MAGSLWTEGLQAAGPSILRDARTPLPGPGLSLVLLQ